MITVIVGGKRPLRFVSGLTTNVFFYSVYREQLALLLNGSENDGTERWSNRHLGN